MTTATIPPVLTFLYEPKPGIRRTLTVRTPDETVLAVWSASAERFRSLGAEWNDAEEALAGKPKDDPEVLEYRALRGAQSQRALGRGLKIVLSAMTEQDDRDWLEDHMLEGRLTLGEALGVLTGAVEELKRLSAEKGPGAPKNGPAKGARRV